MNCLLRGRAGEVTVFASPGSLFAGNLPAALAGAVTAFLQSDLISHRREIMSLGNLLHFFRDANQEEEQEKDEQTFYAGQQPLVAKAPQDSASRAYLFRTAALMIVGIAAAAALFFVILRGDAAQRSFAAEIKAGMRLRRTRNNTKK